MPGEDTRVRWRALQVRWDLLRRQTPSLLCPASVCGRAQFEMAGSACCAAGSRRRRRADLRARCYYTIAIDVIADGLYLRLGTKSGGPVARTAGARYPGATLHVIAREPAAQSRSPGPRMRSTTRSSGSPAGRSRSSARRAPPPPPSRRPGSPSPSRAGRARARFTISVLYSGASGDGPDDVEVLSPHPPRCPSRHARATSATMRRGLPPASCGRWRLTPTARARRVACAGWAARSRRRTGRAVASAARRGRRRAGPPAHLPAALREPHARWSSPARRPRSTPRARAPLDAGHRRPLAFALRQQPAATPPRLCPPRPRPGCRHRRGPGPPPGARGSRLPRGPVRAHRVRWRAGRHDAARRRCAGRRRRALRGTRPGTTSAGSTQGGSSRASGGDGPGCAASPCQRRLVFLTHARPEAP